MKNYYDILEITKDANASEIKRAYFKQVKQYSPEKDPEGFKNLRIAYETLKDASKRKAYDKKEDEDIPEYLVEELQLVSDMMENLHTKEAIATLEYLTKKYPSEPKVVSLLGETYLYAGSSGKAVKYLEQVAEDFEENQDVQLVLAKAYDKRGYHNKAFVQFEQTVELDRTNASTWQAYIEFCDREFPYYRSRVFDEAMAVDEEMFVDKDFSLYALFALSILKSYFLTSITDFDLEEPRVLRCLDLFIKGIKQHGRIPDGKFEIAFAFALAICKVIGNDKITELIPYLEAGVNEDEDYVEMLKHIKEDMVIEDFLQDDNISEAIRQLIVYGMDVSSDCSCPECEKEEQFDTKSALLMLKTEIITNIVVYKGSILYFKEKYPRIYSREEEFLNDALNPAKTRILEDKLQNEAVRFFKKNPSQLKRILRGGGYDFDFDFDDDMDYNPGVTYVRQTAKVGRNDPCPCDSGKKYKRCCG